MGNIFIKKRFSSGRFLYLSVFSSVFSRGMRNLSNKLCSISLDKEKETWKINSVKKLFRLYKKQRNAIDFILINIKSAILTSNFDCINGETQKAQFYYWNFSMKITWSFCPGYYSFIYPIMGWFRKVYSVGMFFLFWIGSSNMKWKEPLIGHSNYCISRMKITIVNLIHLCSWKEAIDLIVKMYSCTLELLKSS